MECGCECQGYLDDRCRERGMCGKHRDPMNMSDEEILAETTPEEMEAAMWLRDKVIAYLDEQGGRPMPVERYCTERDCEAGDLCKHGRPQDGSACVYEYVAAEYEPEYRWKGDGPPPRRWVATNGTVVYRSFADYCD